MNELISIIVINYNGTRWNERFLESLLKQTYQNFELIFVDNASTDKSVEIVKNKYQDKRIKIIQSTDNLGFAGGNNLGIEEASGDLIMLINNDTWFMPNMLEKVYTFYKKNDFDLVAPLIMHYENNNNFVPHHWKIDFWGHPVRISGGSSKDAFYIGGACLFFSKELYKTTHGLDNNFFMYSEEVDWFWRLSLENKRYTYVSNVFVYHFGSGSSGSGLKVTSFLWRNQNVLQMLLKNYRWYNLIWVLPGYFMQNFFEVLFFLFTLKPKIAATYFQGLYFNLKNLKRTLKQRKIVQEQRVVSDWAIMRKMYFGSAKLKHLLRFYESKS